MGKRSYINIFYFKLAGNIFIDIDVNDIQKFLLVEMHINISDQK
jgi:hypothetical protein